MRIKLYFETPLLQVKYSWRIFYFYVLFMKSTYEIFHSLQIWIQITQKVFAKDFLFSCIVDCDRRDNLYQKVKHNFLQEF